VAWICPLHVAMQLASTHVKFVIICYYCIMPVYMPVWGGASIDFW